MNPRDELDSLALQQLHLHHLRAIGLCVKASDERDVEKAKSCTERPTLHRTRSVV